MACPALPLCGLAVTEAERALPDINARVRAMMTKVGRRVVGSTARGAGTSYRADALMLCTFLDWQVCTTTSATGRVLISTAVVWTCGPIRMSALLCGAYLLLRRRLKQSADLPTALMP